MSQYPSVPPPGAYASPTQTSQPPNVYQHQQQQQQQQQPHNGYQQTQVQSSYGAPSPNYNSQGSHKPTKALGQVFNQAVTQGKPMLDKLGKSISSKLNKQPKQSTPQHLQSYQSYQQHHQPQGQTPAQQYQPAQSQNYPGQGQPFTAGQQSAYQTPQQSPYGQSVYGSPVPGQSNYFPQQAPPAPFPQASQYQQPTNSSPNPAEQTYHYAGQLPGPPTQGQNVQGQPQGLPPQTPHGQASGQQTGIIGNSQAQTQSPLPQPSPVSSAPSGSFSPLVNQQHQHQQWTASPPTPHGQTPPAPQSPPPPQQFHAAPPVPAHPNQSQPQQNAQPQPQQWTSMPPPSPQIQQGQAPPPSSSPHPNQPQPQQWTSMPPPSPQIQQAQAPPPSSSPHPQQSEIQKPATPMTPVQGQPPHQGPPNNSQGQATHPSTPISQNAAPNPPQTEFIAELPADLGNLSFVEDSAKTGPVSPKTSQGAPYQAYRPVSGQSTSSGPGYTIPRRAVSTSSLPLADPWRFADPATELPTREFYIIADLVFDSIDRKFEPHSTGLLEASKVLASWRAQELPEEAAQLFAHDTYSAFSKIWSLEGVPHVMVPIQPSLTPTWNFQTQIHAQEMRIREESELATVSYPSYMPALNRAGWYKYLFLNVLHQPDELEKMLNAFCTDTYKPNILNQPDIQKRDRNEPAGLVSRATAISTMAVSRVCEEVVAHMQGASRQEGSQQAGAPTEGARGQGQMSHEGATDADIALKMHSLQIQQQFNNMMNHTMTQGGISFSSAAGNAYKPNYGSLV